MANVKISNLTAASTPLAGTEVLPIVQSGATVKASIANVQTATYSGGTANGVAYLNGSKVLTTGSALVFDGTNLGLGVTPSAWRNLFNVLQSGASSSFVGQTNSNTTYVASNWYSTSGGTDTRIAAGYASQYYQDSGQHVWRTAATSTAGSAISFTTAMTLDASGNLGIGVTSSGAALEIKRNTGNVAYFYNNAGTGVALSAGNNAWSSISDERVKDIIEPITNATEKVSTLRAVIGKYKSDEEDRRRSFLIAQDVQAVFPEAVSPWKLPDDETEYLGVQYTDVIPLLVAAIQEQQALITTLTDRITALEAR